jgi:hypothetical protein
MRFTDRLDEVEEAAADGEPGGPNGFWLVGRFSPQIVLCSRLREVATAKLLREEFDIPETKFSSQNRPGSAPSEPEVADFLSFVSTRYGSDDFSLFLC